MRSFLLIKPLIMLVGMATGFVVKAQLSFAPQLTYPTGINPYGVAAGDFNNDGRQDLAVTSEDNTLSILLGNGDGSFQPQLTYAVSYGNSNNVATGDFNGDGRQDIVVTAGPSSTISVLLGNGDGTFAPPVSYGTSSGTFVAVGDFNGDGKQDIAALDNGELHFIGKLYIFLGNGNGTFQPPATYGTGPNGGFASEPYAIAINDYNNDGKQDLAIADNRGSMIILLGVGDGSFPTQTYFTYGTNYRPMSLATADFNGDGKPDLAAINYGENSVSILSGNGDGTFQPQVSYATGNNSQYVAEGDFNGDGKPDLAVSNINDQTVGVLLNNEDGTFQPQVAFAVSAFPGVIAPGDFNGDGRQDIAVSNSFTSAYNTVGILLNTTPLATPVKLQSFTGALKNGTAVLQWATGVETNFSHFEITAQTAKGGSFTTVATVKAKGSNNSYTYSLPQTAASVNYRLKIVDNDGSTAYSDVLTLSQRGTGKIAIYPNPAISNINVDAEASGSFQLINLTGSVVMKGKLQAGNNVIHLANMPAGTYVLRIGDETYKVIIK